METTRIPAQHETTERALRVGRIGSARYLPIGRALPFLSKGDKVLVRVIVYKDLDGTMINWTAELSFIPKDPIVPIKRKSK